MLLVFFKVFDLTILYLRWPVFCISQEISFQGIICVIFKSDVNVTATTNLIAVKNQKHRFAQIYTQNCDSALSGRISERCVLSVLVIL